MSSSDIDLTQAEALLWPLRLMDVLANMGQDMVTVSLQDANSSALITNPEYEGFKYVVMPMRI